MAKRKFPRDITQRPPPTPSRTTRDPSSPPPSRASGSGYPLLLAAGAGITGILRANDAYLRKVATMGFPRYEKAHRMRLTATCARVVFPRLPVDAVSHVVAFAFHTGYY